MIIFLDSADIDEIKSLSQIGLIDGITTNPSLIAKSSKNFLVTVKQICTEIKGPVSVEVSGTEFDEMKAQGDEILSIADNIVLKLPITIEGIKLCKYFSSKGAAVNMTLCFSASQALLAAKSGAAYVSPFVGRLDDINQDGINLIREIKLIYQNYPEFKTKILAASIRNQSHFLEVAKIGAHAVTMPGALIKKLLSHPLTDQGIEIFKNDWQNSGLKI